MGRTQVSTYIYFFLICFGMTICLIRYDVNRICMGIVKEDIKGMLRVTFARDESQERIAALSGDQLEREAGKIWKL
jgi:hypothetical protein